MQKTKIYEQKGKIEIPILNTKFTLECIRQEGELWEINVFNPETYKKKKVSNDTPTMILRLLSDLYLDHSIEFNK